MSDLLKESIADAKAVRDTAIENAKTFLEEHFAKSMQEMFAEKLKEESDEQEPEQECTAENTEAVDETQIEELNTSKIGGEKGNEAGKQHPVKPSTDASKSTTKDSAQIWDATMEENVDQTAEVEEGMEVTSEEIDEILSELETEGMDMDSGDSGVTPDVSSEVPVDSGELDEINLDELLAELEAEGEAAPVAQAPVAQAAPVAPAPQVDPVTGLPITQPAPAPAVGQVPSPNENLYEEDECDECDVTDEEIAEALLALNEENKSLKKKLAKSEEGLRYVKSVLEESNILNAKLLYTNKLFKNKNLTENQKLKVINTFDLTKTLREIKLAYTVLAESFNAGGSVAKKKTSTNATVSTITEGLASKPVTSTKPSSIVDAQVDEMASRFQKLAGIKK